LADKSFIPSLYWSKYNIIIPGSRALWSGEHRLHSRCQSRSVTTTFCQISPLWKPIKLHFLHMFLFYVNKGHQEGASNYEEHQKWLTAAIVMKTFTAPVPAVTYW